jgi:hypothetical protein
MLKEANHGFGARFEMGSSWGERGVGAGLRKAAAARFTGKQMGERKRAEPTGRNTQK